MWSSLKIKVLSKNKNKPEKKHHRSHTRKEEKFHRISPNKSLTDKQKQHPKKNKVEVFYNILSKYIQQNLGHT
jgi:hypothetical protein